MSDDLSHSDVSLESVGIVKLADSSKKNKRKVSSNRFNANIGKKAKPRPNYFIGIQISNPDILGKIHAIQNVIKSADSRFTNTIVSTATTHITLAVMHLEENQVSKVVEILNTNRADILNIIGRRGLEITLKGLGHFRNQVLFAEIAPGDHLNKTKALSDLLTEMLVEYLAAIEKAFTPHATILKLSRLYGRLKRKIKKIPPSLYEDMNDVRFGCETAKSLQLLSMKKRKQANGYYHSEYTLYFDEEAEEASSDFSLHNWSHCIAVSCITCALHSLARFSEQLSEKAVKEGLQSYKNTLVLKQSGNLEQIKNRVANLKQIITSELTKQKILEGLNMTE